ncbi:hNH endonuclease [Citrobacter portucalensis]|uniref:hNH endonuclease n=1 Tax=Citrobacter portucalensis TaxID=1639133 RepID=UPI00301E4D51
MTVYEMEGFLRGKCLPGDMKVNESNAQYLVRKFSEFESKLSDSQREFRAADATIHNLELKLTDMAVQLANAESKCRGMAAENAIKQEFIKTCFRAAADGASMDGADIQEFGERLGLFGRETYQPVLHGYICGHEAGEDTVYVMKKTQATDAFLAEVRAQGVEMFAQSLHVSGKGKHLYSEIAEKFAAKLRKGAAL